MIYKIRALEEESNEALQAFLQEVKDAIATANSIHVFPQPGVLEEMFASRGVRVEIEVNGLEDEDKTVAVIHRKSGGQ